MKADIPLSADLDALIGSTFPGEANEARKILMGYAGNEADRVRRGIIKLSAGSLDQLAHYAAQAIQDYRDILYWSEYPEN